MSPRYERKPVSAIISTKLCSDRVAGGGTLVGRGVAVHKEAILDLLFADQIISNPALLISRAGASAG